MLNVSLKHYSKDAFPYVRDLETYSLPGPYISDSLAKELPFFNHHRAIFLSMQTGCGKTLFCDNVLIKDAISKDKKIVILSNRISLNLAIKRDILRRYDIFDKWSDEGLRKENYLGDSIIVSTYQGFMSIVNDINEDAVEYVVCDEIHYLMLDSKFSSTTGLLLKTIPNKFKHCKRIYMSATVDEVLPYICKFELNTTAVDNYRFKKRGCKKSPQNTKRSS